MASSTHKSFNNKISTSLFMVVFPLFYGYYLLYCSVSWKFSVRECIFKASCFPFSQGLSAMVLPSPRLPPEASAWLSGVACLLLALVICSYSASHNQWCTDLVCQCLVPASNTTIYTSKQKNTHIDPMYL